MKNNKDSQTGQVTPKKYFKKGFLRDCIEKSDYLENSFETETKLAQFIQSQAL